MVHVVNKGKEGEREIARYLRGVIGDVIKQIPTLTQTDIDRLSEIVQRNTNQSSSGGCDIMLFGIAIEVKRQETLNLNNWWNQCLTSAVRNDHTPVLIWRQNRKPWSVMMHVEIPISETGESVLGVGVVKLEHFLTWFHHHITNVIKRGDQFTI